MAPALLETQPLVGETIIQGVNTPLKVNGIKTTQDNLKRPYLQFLDDAEGPGIGQLFDPKKHLAFQEPSSILTMEDIGFPSSNGVSPIAVSEPFQLFTQEAIEIMRSEIMSKEVQEGYSYTSDIAPKQLRGYAPKHAKFIYEAWKHPKTLSLLSKIAGVELVPVIDYEIGHINLSITKKKEGSSDDESAIVGWHRDSYPFVCVLMMSDTTNMVGGETALRTGTGEIMKVRGPSKGCAVVLQGRYIDHQALSAYGGQERITMVTSFRPRSANIRDDTVLNTVRPISDLSDLYGQTVEYQLENTEERIRKMLKQIRDQMKIGSLNVPAIKEFLQFEINALAHLNNEIVDPSLVKKGFVREVCEEANGTKRIKSDA
ncbi:hypothetical protein F5884DRAFT_666060 [Xylogone sp. PMI_703]|nr:hypothetical protein F5884DRAFT_666060 [Xylogone sp. PMI_703]